MLHHRGRVDDRALKRHPLEHGDLLGAAREHGTGSLDQAEAVVRQSDGTLAEVTPDKVGDGCALDVVRDP